MRCTRLFFRPDTLRYASLQISTLVLVLCTLALVFAAARDDPDDVLAAAARSRRKKKKPPCDAVDARFLIKAVKPEMGWQRTQIILMYASLCFKSAAVYSILPLPCEKPGSLSAHRCERIKAFSCSQREKGWGVEGGGGEDYPAQTILKGG